MSVDINPKDHTQGRRPTGIMTTFDGNYSTNYSMVKNVRMADHLHFGECDEECPDCPDV